MAINAERDINILYYTETDIREDEGESNYETLPFVSIIESLLNLIISLQLLEN